jgi:hypothetical protein
MANQAGDHEVKEPIPFFWTLAIYFLFWIVIIKTTKGDRTVALCRFNSLEIGIGIGIKVSDRVRFSYPIAAPADGASDN